MFPVMLPARAGGTVGRRRRAGASGRGVNVATLRAASALRKPAPALGSICCAKRHLPLLSVNALSWPSRALFTLWIEQGHPDRIDGKLDWPVSLERPFWTAGGRDDGRNRVVASALTLGSLPALCAPWFRLRTGERGDLLAQWPHRSTLVNLIPRSVPGLY